MPEVMALRTLAKELDRRLENMEDFHADTRKLGFTVDVAEQPDTNGSASGRRSRRQRREEREKRPPNTTELSIDLPDDTWYGQINEHAQHQMAERLKLGWRFWERMRDDHPDILQDTVRRLLEREHEIRMVRTLDGKVRAFLSNGYAARDNYDLMNRAVLPAIKESDMDIKQCALTEQRLYLKVCFPDVQEEVQVGDIVQAGVVISNSEVGAGSTAVEPFLYRLLCKNGMIAPIRFAEFGLRKHHLGRRIGEDADSRDLFSEKSLMLEDEAFFSMLYDVIKGSITGVRFTQMVAKLRDLMDLPTKGDPVAVVERISRRERLTDDERGSIMRHLIEESDTTAYGYANALTRTAQDSSRYDRQVALERVGGEMLTWSDQAWTELLAAREGADGA